jgi:hypothetical protein
MSDDKKDANAYYCPTCGAEVGLMGHGPEGCPKQEPEGPPSMTSQDREDPFEPWSTERVTHTAVRLRHTCRHCSKVVIGHGTDEIRRHAGREHAAEGHFEVEIEGRNHDVFYFTTRQRMISHQQVTGHFRGDFRGKGWYLVLPDERTRWEGDDSYTETTYHYQPLLEWADQAEKRAARLIGDARGVRMDLKIVTEREKK